MRLRVSAAGSICGQLLSVNVYWRWSKSVSDYSTTWLGIIFNFKTLLY